MYTYDVSQSCSNVTLQYQTKVCSSSFLFLCNYSLVLMYFSDALMLQCNTTLRCDLAVFIIGKKKMCDLTCILYVLEMGRCIIYSHRTHYSTWLLVGFQCFYGIGP